MTHLTNIIKFVVGLVSGTIGFLILGVGLLGIIDPTGTKMADDPDPFGPTDGIITTGIIIMVVGLALIAGSGYILWRIDKSK
ncbi:MAG: hypothetical protein IPL32_16380 [Chloracidobacterium sp.]|nr:hypothetical protein [Chloracidobacterium sp.]